jgi:hypothetical protein
VTDRHLPYDRDLERRLLAELGGALNRPDHLEGVKPDDFLDERHLRIAVAIRAGKPQRDERDQRYLDDCVRWAWPLARGDREKFLDLAARRRRALELEAELAALLDYGPELAGLGT